jgi:hypothetical protein
MLHMRLPDGGAECVCDCPGIVSSTALPDVLATFTADRVRTPVVLPNTATGLGPAGVAGDGAGIACGCADCHAVFDDLAAAG